ncbi:MAG: hypothetical protein ACR2PK_11620 [Acidimicrobiales bacterium]
MSKGTDVSGRSHRTTMRQLGVVAFLLLGVFALLASCSSDDDGASGPGQDSGADSGSGDGGSGDGGGGDGSSGGGGDGGTTSGGTTDSSGTDTAEEGLSSEDWLIIALLGVAAIAIVLFATSAASKRSDDKRAAQASLNSRLGQITGNARWIHDQGSADVMRATDPQQLRSVWNDTRTRMVDLEGNIATQAATVKDPTTQQALTNLQSSVAGLRGALESDVSTRLDETADDSLRQSSGQTVYSRRQQLQAAIGPVAAAQR